MKKIETRELQLMKLEILKEIDAICGKENIRYFLAYGTLIGAAREHGFLSWDEDIDLYMLRPDYEKFCAAAGNYLSRKYFLQNYDTDKYFLFPITRICIEGTYRSSGVSENVRIHRGTFVDIFPLDKVSSDIRKTERQYDKVQKIKTMWGYRIKCPNSKTAAKKLAKYAIKGFLRLIPMSCVKNDLIRTMRNSGESDSGTLCCLAGDYGVKRESFKAEWFAGSITMKFEGIDFACPVGYHQLLTHIYGDYMTPPKNKDRKIDPPSYMMDEQ